MGGGASGRLKGRGNQSRGWGSGRNRTGNFAGLAIQSDFAGVGKRKTRRWRRQQKRHRRSRQPLRTLAAVHRAGGHLRQVRAAIRRRTRPAWRFRIVLPARRTLSRRTAALPAPPGKRSRGPGRIQQRYGKQTNTGLQGSAPRGIPRLHLASFPSAYHTIDGREALAPFAARRHIGLFFPA